MNLDSARAFCMSLPRATEGVQWDNDLLFRVGGKMFAVAALDAASPIRLSFKCKPEVAQELCERQNVVPAPYLARYHWVALQSWNAIPDAELRQLLRASYDLVLEGLPKKVRDSLGASPARERPRAASRKRAARPATKRTRR